MDKLHPCTDFGVIKDFKYKNEPLIYFQIAPEIDLAQLESLEIDINNSEMQIYEGAGMDFGVHVTDDPIVCRQLVPFFIDRKLKQGAQIQKFIRIIKIENVPTIKRKAIKKLKLRE